MEGNLSPIFLAATVNFLTVARNWRGPYVARSVFIRSPQYLLLTELGPLDLRRRTTPVSRPRTLCRRPIRIRHVSRPWQRSLRRRTCAEEPPGLSFLELRRRIAPPIHDIAPRSAYHHYFSRVSVRRTRRMQSARCLPICLRFPL